MSSLDISLRDQISVALRPVAVEQLWGQQPAQFTFAEGKANLDAYFSPYFRYYAQQCDLIGRHSNGKYSSVETHRDVMRITKFLQPFAHRDEVRKQISDIIRHADKDQHQNSINLAVRLLLMIRVGNVPHECLGGRQLEWKEGSLLQFVRNSFAPPLVRSHERMKLEKSFSAVNLQRIAGIEIWWTDNLADHLRMMDDDKAVFVFHHASFLEYQLYNPIYPPTLIEETLRTIALLLPLYDVPTKKWYQKVAAKSSHCLDMQLIGIDNLNAEKRQIENFQYWHDRLVILKEVYDEARPSTLFQFWYDRRNGPQWYTFWIALWVLILTIFALGLGLVQCIEGGLQVYAAFKS